MKGIKAALPISIALLTACTTPGIKKSLPSTPLIPIKPSGVKSSSMSQLPITKGTKPAHAVSSWNITGALAARNKQKSWTASLNWSQQGANQYHIHLSGPIGGGTLLIDKQGNQVTYRDDAKVYTSNSAEKLLLAHTGIRLPVNNLYYWVRGIPAPGAVQSEQRMGNVLSQLRQNGYTISYGEYTNINGIALPSKIRLEGNGVFMKLVIKQWRIA